MSQRELPPYLREMLARFDQTQQNLQAVQIQKQQVEMELNEAEKALQELNKASESESIYKFAGNLLIKVSKTEMVKELNEKKELSSTRKMVLTKQEGRFKESLKDLQTKIDDSVKGKAPQAAAEDQ
ncbi:MAG: prefoldin subunit beta [Nitrososphaerales archaeon]|nr:prefoldin subunit beta [Nitrososphaerales archaeon]